MPAPPALSPMRAITRPTASSQVSGVCPGGAMERGDTRVTPGRSGGDRDCVQYTGSGPDDPDNAGPAVHLDRGAIRNEPGAIAGGDDGGDAELARDHGGVGEDAAVVGDQGAGQRQDSRP